LFNVIKHLLPRAKAWKITQDLTLRQLFEAISPTFDSVVEYFDLLWFDMFPAYTRHLTQWESQFGLKPLDLTEQERRDRLAALWAATGGQSPRYIQDTLQAAGFDVYVHEWWELPLADPPVARNPFTALGITEYGCGDPEMECGEPFAECGNGYGQTGYMLVNKLRETGVDYTTLCGEPLSECGEPSMECGEGATIRYFRVEYAPPRDPTKWPYIYYIGGATFGDYAAVQGSRREEFEELILKISPQHLWVGMLIDYQVFLVEDETQYQLLEDETALPLVEA